MIRVRRHGGWCWGGVGLLGALSFAACSASSKDKNGTTTEGNPSQPGNSDDPATILDPNIPAEDAPILGATPTGDKDKPQTCKSLDEAAEKKAVPADIIWAIDGSGSMQNEADAVKKNMNTFADTLAKSGLDAHLILIAGTDGATASPDAGTSTGGGANPFPWLPGGGGGGGSWMGGGGFGCIGVCLASPIGSGSCPTDSNPMTGFLHINDCPDSFNSLNRIVALYDQYKDQLRPNATKHFVVVTDDDATHGNYSADDFTAAIKAKDPKMFAKWTFDGIIADSKCAGVANEGLVYKALISSTKGVKGDLCSLGSAFEPVFNDLAKAVVAGAGISCEWGIPPAPSGQTLDLAKVRVSYTPQGGKEQEILKVPGTAECGSKGGWKYDDPSTPTKVVACPATCTTLQKTTTGSVKVGFGCAPQEVPPG